jgi:phage shock protein A
MSEPIDAEIVPDDKQQPDKQRLDEPLPVVGPTDYNDQGVPTFDYVRDRIENRTATSAGMRELTGESPQAKTIDEQMAERDKAGRDKLEEIRRSMRGE